LKKLTDEKILDGFDSLLRADRPLRTSTRKPYPNSHPKVTLSPSPAYLFRALKSRLMQFFLDRHRLAMAECDLIPYRSSDYALVRLLVPGSPHRLPECCDELLYA
jgi:hypothetical protein